MPRDGALQDGVPRDGVPRDGVPRDGALRDGVPRDGMPRDGALRDGMPRDGMPRDGVPRDGVPRGRSLGEEPGHLDRLEVLVKRLLHALDGLLDAVGALVEDALDEHLGGGAKRVGRMAVYRTGALGRGGAASSGSGRGVPGRWTFA